MKISPSQINSFRRCQRLIGFQQVEKIRAPSTEKQRYGTDVHKQLERWLSEAEPPGDVAKQGIRWLPVPGRDLLVEKKFEFEWAAGITVRGIIDCAYPDEGLVIDHKTTSDLKYAMSPEELATDPQAIIYAVWAAVTWKRPRIRARWVYYAAGPPKAGVRKPAGALPVEVKFDVWRPEFGRLIDGLSCDMDRIYAIRTEERRGLDLPGSFENCGMYGGCFFKNVCEPTPIQQFVAFLRKK